jgi:hypothetical protein
MEKANAKLTRSKAVLEKQVRLVFVVSGRCVVGAPVCVVGCGHHIAPF